MGRRMLAGALALLAASTAWVVARPAQSGAVPITTADQLVGRMLATTDGQSAGRINGVVLDVPRGDVLYVVVGSGGRLDIGDSLIPVPFGALEVDPSTDGKRVRVNQSLAQIRSRSPLESARLAGLGTPEWVGQIYRIYGVPVPFGYAVPVGPAPAVPPFRDITKAPDPNRLTIISDPSHALAMDVRGLSVIEPDAHPIGQIDQVVIDPTDGRIAYLLLASPRFLGLSEAWIPVPPEAVTWSAATFVLDETNVKPQAMAALHKSKLPAQVARADLVALYTRFKLTPYWEQQTQRSPTGRRHASG